MVSERKRSPVLFLSDAALLRISHLLSCNESSGKNLRLSLKNSGCAGMAYVLEFTDVYEPNDEVIEEKGVRLLIDSGAVLFLLGTRMDYVESKLSAGFVFENPNQKGVCGCGESVSLVPSSSSNSSVDPP
ncbi:MAG: iron-sulfur cluster assembly accessory protein [Alphaproteobacteria bacterium]|nr:iron-sulfur cluster assembly accessory protein [Alphaproteobacteria bacterium]